MNEIEERQKVSKEAMTAIIVSGVVAVLCILACTTVLITLILNAPW